LILLAEPVDKNKGKGFLKKAKSKSNVCSTKTVCCLFLIHHLIEHWWRKAIVDGCIAGSRVDVKV
jgi:hypothetical protein